MKYLKLFESLNKEDYYIDITNSEDIRSQHDWDRWGIMYPYRESVLMDKRLFDIIKSHIPAIWEINLLRNDGWYPNFNKSTYLYGSFNKSWGREYQIMICELIDEWFILHIKERDAYSEHTIINKTYKCDQLSGLIELIDDKIVNLNL